jgi:hypothetical protein
MRRKVCVRTYGSFDPRTSQPTQPKHQTLAADKSFRSMHGVADSEGISLIGISSKRSLAHGARARTKLVGASLARESGCRQRGLLLLEVIITTITKSREGAGCVRVVPMGRAAKEHLDCD